jgi:hypothetical protein
MAKASKDSTTPEPKTPEEPAAGPKTLEELASEQIIHNTGVNLASKSGLKIDAEDAVDARVYRPIDVTDWGRPSPKGLYMAEAERRLKDGKAPATNKEFANEIRVWFIDTYPNKKPPAVLTIERNIGELRPRRQR